MKDLFQITKLLKFIKEIDNEMKTCSNTIEKNIIVINELDNFGTELHLINHEQLKYLFFPRYIFFLEL